MNKERRLYKWKYAVLVSVLFFCIWQKATAQPQKITGSVKDTAGQPLSATSVYLADNDTTLISFALTNNNGYFSITVAQEYQKKQMWIEARHIGYYQQRKVLLQNHNEYHFILKPDPLMLSEVIAKNRPVLEQMGDTLRYIVSTFAQKEDRSIGDVLRRMPGIRVEEDGAIYHNGKKIENLYIHGDDLMSGRYGLASKIIRKEMISSVDVIQHHQPIKVIQGKVFSDQTAINLVLKNENEVKVSGAAKLGIGIPGLYDASGNAILLNKVFKAVNNISVNNSGVDYKNEFKKLGGSNMVTDVSREPGIISLSMGDVGTPDIPQRYFYWNRSGIVNLNNLYNTKKGLQFKANIQAYIDRNEFRYDRITEKYDGDNTIIYKEQQQNINRPYALNTSINFMVNKENFFFE